MPGELYGAFLDDVAGIGGFARPKQNLAVLELLGLGANGDDLQG